MTRVAVVGAGIAGITTAYYLAKAGYDVTVYEQERYPAMRTSFANGGQVSVSNSEVWTTWDNVYKGIKWMFTKDAPLLFSPSFDWDKMVWMSKFLLATASNKYEHNTATTIHYGLDSRRLYKQIIEEENISFDQSDCGIVHFYKDKKYFDAAKRAKSIYEKNGVEWDIISPTQIEILVPQLKNSTGIIGGIWTKSDWTGDIHIFCTKLAEILKTKYKVKFIHNVVIDHYTQVSLYDYVVIANGVGSTKLAKTVGDSIGVYPVKGYSITINTPDGANLPSASLLDDQAKIVTSTLGNRFRVAGTAELAGENYDIRRDRIAPLLRWVETNFPDIDANDYSSWACLRPMTPDMMPVVGQSRKIGKVFYNTGHGHLGWTLSPATAKKVVNYIKCDQ